MRVGYFGPEGTFTQEALIAALARGASASASWSPLPTVHDTVIAVQTAPSNAPWCRSRTRSRARSTRPSTRWRSRPTTWRSSVRSIHPIRHCLIAREPLELTDIEVVVSHPQANAQCARFIRARLPRPACWPAPRPPRPCAWSPSRRAVGGARDTALAAERYGCQVLLDGVEDVAGNETRFVWLGPLGAPAGAAGSRTRWPVEDGDGLLGRRSRSAGLAGRLPVRVRLARREPDADRIAAAQAGARAVHVLPRPRGPRRRAGRRRGPCRTAAGRVETLRVLGSFPAARDSALASVGKLRAAHGLLSTSASVVRVASRAPATRT